MHDYAFRSIGDNVTIYPMARIIGAENLEIGSNVIIDDFVLIQASRPCYIGNYVHIASFTSITGGGSFCLEDFSTLSSGVRFFSGTDDFLGTGMANSTIPDEYRNATRSTTILRAHGLVGANTTVLAGVTIGTGAAIGAGSLVRKSLPSWQVYAGNPLRTLRERPSDSILRQEQELYTKYGTPEKLYRDVLQVAPEALSLLRKHSLPLTNMNNSKVSVALCTFNGQRYLNELLDSLCSQHYKPAELIVSDDCSTDLKILMPQDFSPDNSIVNHLINKDRQGEIHNFLGHSWRMKWVASYNSEMRSVIYRLANRRH